MANKTRPLFNDYAGGVGVGTSNLPAAKMQVAGNILPELPLTYSIGSLSLPWNTAYIDLMVGTSSLTVTSSFTISSSFASIASFALRSSQSLFATRSIYSTQSIYATQSLFATESISASFILGSNVVGIVQSASYAMTASYVSASSFDGIIASASYARTSSVAISASYSTASFYADSASYAISSSCTISASYITASGIDGIVTSASYAFTASMALYSPPSLSSSYAYTASWTPPPPRAIVLCTAYTPTLVGADAAEVPLPYFTDGVTPLSWSINRLNLRVQVYGSTASLDVEGSTSTGSFSPITLGTLNLNSGSYETSTGSLSTLVSGDKIRFNIVTLGTAQNWTVTVECSNK